MLKMLKFVLCWSFERMEPCFLMGGRGFGREGGCDFQGWYAVFW